MRILRQAIPKEILLAATRKIAYRGEAISVRRLRSGICTKVKREEAHVLT